MMNKHQNAAQKYRKFYIWNNEKRYEEEYVGEKCDKGIRIMESEEIKKAMGIVRSQKNGRFD